MKNATFLRLTVGKHPRKTIVRIIICLIVCIILFKFVLIPVRIKGISMYPTLKENSLHVGNLTAYTFSEPAHGDIILIEMAGRKAIYIKRILAVPGDTISFANGILLINGYPVEEPYIKDQGTWEMKPTNIKAMTYFVAGDNRTIPMELHALGFVKRDKIAGKLLF